jgi:hypothetical protein
MLVAAVAVSAALCTTAVICLEFELWQAAKDQKMLCVGETLSWSNGLYEASGTISGGRLERLVIERSLPVLKEAP